MSIEIGSSCCTMNIEAPMLYGRFSVLSLVRSFVFYGGDVILSVEIVFYLMRFTYLPSASYELLSGME